MVKDGDFESGNKSLKKDKETALTKLEMRVCEYYINGEDCKGDKLNSLRQAEYSPLLDYNKAPREQIGSFVRRFFGRVAIKNHLKTLSEERGQGSPYDRRSVEDNYIKIMNQSLVDPRTDEQKDPDSNEFYQWKPNLMLAKQTNDSMARTKSMFTDTVIQVEGESAADMAQKAFAKNREARKKASGEQLALGKGVDNGEDK